MSRRRQAVLLLFSLGCFVLLCVWCSGLVPLDLLSPCFVSLLWPPLGLFSGAFWSSQCSAGPSLWVSGCICDGPVVMLGMVCCDGLAPFFTLFTASTRCCVCCFGAPPSCTEVFTIGVIQIPPQDAARAACAPLLGPCCSSLLFLLPSQAPSLLLLLASACCLLPRPFRSLASFARFAAFVCFGLLFVAPLLWPFVVVGLFLSGVFGLVFPCFLSDLFWFGGCACCQLAKVTKDY